MTTTFQTLISKALVAMLLLYGVVAMVPEAKAATLESSTNSRIFELSAKLEYLKAFLKALQSGKHSPAPTYVVALNGDIGIISGTVARDADATRVEVCGPMSKGMVDWGDGVSETIRGLGCSGDAHAFKVFHRYRESGSYTITVTDATGRTKTHVIAVNAVDNPSVPVIDTSIDDNVVKLNGRSVLGVATKQSCGDEAQGTVDWGDGQTETLPAGCSKLSFILEHTYPGPGTYKLFVLDREGDMTEEVIVIEE